MKLETNYLNLKERKIQKEMQKYAGAAILTSALLLGGVSLYDVSVAAVEHTKIDHTEELCPLVSIVGAEHQVNKINSIDGLSAKVETRYYAPSGYSLGYENGKPVAYATIINEDGTVTKKVYGNIPSVDEIIISNESDEVVNTIRVR